MSRAIKVEDQVYQQLDMIREKGETFSQVIELLLKARLSIFEFISVLEGQVKYHKWQRKQVDAMIEARAERADLDARTIKQ